MVRLAAFLTALLLFAAPLAAVACEATCSERDVESPAPVGHTCHQHAASTQGRAVGGIHVCGHDDGAMGALEQVSASLHMPAIATVILPHVSRSVTIAHRRTVDLSPPTSLALVSQLRI